MTPIPHANTIRPAHEKHSAPLIPSVHRYALYFSPETTSRWWQAGNQWLGRDPSSSVVQDLIQPTISGVTAENQRILTASARRYGFHATLKAPFRLRDGEDFAALDQVLSTFCQQQTAQIVQLPTVQWMGDFLALRPESDSHDMMSFAQACVASCDHLRAPLSQTEQERRRPDRLSVRQRELLARWGYPFTEEAFRFHMTLSDKVTHQTDADLLYEAAVRHFDIREDLCIASVSLFYEPTAGADFQLLQRYPLAASTISASACHNSGRTD
ncbi:DUF1045 domain-containing protein [Undibacterium sp. SXout7W]|uniref:DUF1045 domain-containing protein n=1 Tax=Undibacterium sp. SXout7W TaxID=3413049 RepID=UPI003BEF77ED